ncbi:MAG: EF-hand domain-containing protein [Rhodobacteraceae bacterium]|nr:EF-hand domain-containing protein [Paracoccaceae bacterium]
MKKTLALMALTGLVAVPLAAGPLFALDRSGMGPDFATLDQNSDGVVTAEEIAARHQARFADADADGNGTLSREELAAGIGKMQAERMQQGADRMIARFDKNGDGALSQDELPSGPQDGMLKRLDANNDGQLDQQEFAAMGHGPQGGPNGGPQGGAPGQKGHGKDCHGDRDGGFWR